MSVSMNHCGCSSALRFIKCKVYSGQKFFELNGQLVARSGSREIKRHVCRDWQSVHQPHLILTKSLIFISGPPQGRYEHSNDRQFDREDSEFFQGGFSRWRRRSHTSSSDEGLAELLHFSLIFGDMSLRRKRSSAQVGDVRY
jgi:hypothetical protein